MPQSLRDDVLQLSQRTSPERLRDLIIRLCRHRDWQAEELSHLLNRDKSYLIKFYLRPLRREGVLKYTEKAYSATKPEES
jgi:ATP-dependent DNA helicase RecG